jgi:outer membrane protein OmpA-like peptidoglycan-associated protein
MKAAGPIAILLTLGTAGAEPTARLAVLRFERGSAALATAHGEELCKVAAWAQRNPEGVLVIDGHADREGTRTETVRLSLARARAVQHVLVEAGLNPDQIVIAAFDTAKSDRGVVVWGTRERFR